MTLNEIARAVSRALHIDSFNEMQLVAAEAKSRRLVLLAPTGSGKTLAFVLAVLKRMSDCRPDTLVIAPSRELVRQIFDVVRPVAALLGLKTAALYGGNQFAAEEASLTSEMPALIIATPGRLLDHIRRGTLDVEGIRSVVLDEYDKILELGFRDEMEAVLTKTGRRLPGGEPDFVMVTSATPLTGGVPFIDMAKAETIDFREVSPAMSRMRIVGVPSPSRDKLDTLAGLIRAVAPDGPAIVFVNHRESADRVGDFLTRQHISNVVYHGGFDQQHREMALASFDSEGARVLVATDLAGRGIDISGVASVIHYHQAGDIDIWTHRNGRTARVGRSGTVYVINGPEEDLPEFVKTENDYYPDLTDGSAVVAPKKLIYFDRGKRDKISRGDIAGFIMKCAGVPADAVGKISVGANYAMAAVSPDFVSAVLSAVKSGRVKGLRLRASLM